MEHVSKAMNVSMHDLCYMENWTLASLGLAGSLRHAAEILVYVRHFYRMLKNVCQMVSDPVKNQNKTWDKLLFNNTYVVLGTTRPLGIYEMIPMDRDQ